jgi:DNA-binding response OmpR family regulator
MPISNHSDRVDRAVLDHGDRALVIEHDRRLQDSICFHLSLESFECERAGSGGSAIAGAGARRFDVVLLDLEMPDALNVCRSLRSDPPHRHTPVLLMTPTTREHEAWSALEDCADDYVLKPIGIRELVARVRALVRRRRHFAAVQAQTACVRCSHLTIDPERHHVQIDGDTLMLTKYEFRLLYILAGNAGVIFDRQALLSRIWGSDTFVTTRSVDALVKRVRRKLRLAGHRGIVVTVRGVGYKLEEG